MFTQDIKNFNKTPQDFSTFNEPKLTNKTSIERYLNNL